MARAEGEVSWRQLEGVVNNEMNGPGVVVIRVDDRLVWEWSVQKPVREDTVLGIKPEDQRAPWVVSGGVESLVSGGRVVGIEARWDPRLGGEDGPWVVDAEGDWEQMPGGFRSALWSEILGALVVAPGVRAAELADEVWGALVAVLRAERGRVGREEVRRVVRTVALTCKGRFTVVSGGG